MNKLITILASLLVVVVSNYSFADDNAPIQLKPKAQNGANDPAVRAEAEKEKQREEKAVSRVTDKDFGSFTQKTSDDHVVQFRRGNELITMIPFRDLWTSSERREAFEAAQLYGEKLMVTWLRRALNIRYPTTDEMVQQELNKLTAAQLRDLLKKAPGTQPTTEEILRASQDAAEAMRKLKADRKFLVEFDDLIEAYDLHQQEIIQATGFKATLKKAVPSAVLVLGSFKVPDALLNSLQNIKFVSGLSVLLKGTVNFSVAVRPWKVLRTNLDTGAVTEDFHFEGTPQAWFLREMVSNQFDVRAPLRLGAGLLLGDYNRDHDINGAVAGASYNFGATNSIVHGAIPVPAYWNLKFGVITSTTNVKNSYVTLSRQFGLTAPIEKKFVTEVGGVFSVSSLTDRIKFKSETLEDLIKLIESEDPGTVITITKGEPILSQPQTPAKPVDPASEKDQGNGQQLR